MTKTWFITGVTSGFGQAMTRRLLARGDKVFGTVRRPGRAVLPGGDFRSAVLDLTDFGRIRTVVDEAFDAFGRIDVVVSNAGYGLFGAAEEVTDAQVRHQLDTNLLGSIQVARAALPHLRAQGGGRLIQLSSYGGLATNPGASLYHASKWGVEGFMESLAKEVAPLGIGVTIVEPGGARTEFRFGGLTLASPLPAYDATPATLVRGVRDRTRPSPGDPDAMAARIIDSADVHPAPLRLVLGSDAYRIATAALRERLAGIEPQRESAAGTDC